jgi:hypothetical protein
MMLSYIPATRYQDLVVRRMQFWTFFPKHKISPNQSHWARHGERAVQAGKKSGSHPSSLNTLNTESANYGEKNLSSIGCELRFPPNSFESFHPPTTTTTATSTVGKLFIKPFFVANTRGQCCNY